MAAGFVIIGAGGAAAFKTVPNDFDPEVSGYAGGEGDRIRTADKMKAWEHGTPVTDATTPDTNWSRIGSGT